MPSGQHGDERQTQGGSVNERAVVVLLQSRPKCPSNQCGATPSPLLYPKLVQHLQGHASITMTLDRYSHWMPSMGRNNADGMDGALG
jgi:hypothetical protein